MSYRAYLGLHSGKHSKKAKAQAHKLEVWLWWFALGLAAVLDILVTLNIG